MPPTLRVRAEARVQVQQLVARLYDSNGFELPITGGTVWSSANNSVCRVDGDGVVWPAQRVDHCRAFR